MISKNLSYKRQLWQNFTNHLWAMVLALLGFVGALIIPVLLTQQSYQQDKKQIAELQYQGAELTNKLEQAFINAQQSMRSVLTLDNPFVKIVMIVLAIICGVALFRYLHDRKQVDFYHALPISRTKLFSIHYISGILWILPIYLIVWVIAYILAFTMGLTGTLTVQDIFQGLWANSIYFMLNYTVAVLCTILTGHTIITILLGFWSMFGVSIIIGLYYITADIYYQTYEKMSRFSEVIFYSASPILGYFALHTDRSISYFNNEQELLGSTITVLIMTVAVVLLILSCYLLFVRRKSERAGMALAFERSQTPIKWFVCLVSGWVFYTLFVALFYLQDQVSGWIGMVFGIVLCHVVVEMLYDFDFKAGLHHWKQMIVLSVICAAGLGAIRFDIFGFDRFIPSPDSVVGVSVENSYTWRYWRYDDLMSDLQLTDSESIQKACELAQIYRDHQSDYSDRTEKKYESDLGIVYWMKNGNKIFRRYPPIEKELVQDKLIDFSTRKTTVETLQVLQYLEVSEQAASTLVVQNQKRDVKQLYNIEDMKAILDTLKQDQIDCARTNLSEIPVYLISVYSEEGMHYDRQNKKYYDIDNVPVYPSNIKTIACIERITALRSEPIKTEDILNVKIVFSKDQLSNEEENQRGTIISDPEQIQSLISNAYPEMMYQEAGVLAEWEYDVRLEAVLEDGMMEQMLYPKGKVPVALIEQLTGVDLD